MSKIENSINILGTIAPLNTEDTYPTHWAKYGKGGYVSVPNKEDIPVSRLENGMRIYETSTNKEWLVSGDENGYTYIEYIVSGGGTISRESNVQNLSSNVTLSSSSDYFQFLNPTTNGYRVTLPATISTDFFEFEIINTSSRRVQLSYNRIICFIQFISYYTFNSPSSNNSCLTTTNC